MSLTTTEMKARTRGLNRKQPLGLVVVDYLQLMSGRGEHREQEVSHISRSLKALSKSENVAVLALSQLNRDVEKRADRKPQLSDLRESGSLEQDADFVFLIYHPSKSGRVDTEGRCLEDGVTEVIVAKQRNGPVGPVQVRWNSSLMRFEDLAPEYRQPQLNQVDGEASK